MRSLQQKPIVTHHFLIAKLILVLNYFLVYRGWKFRFFLFTIFPSFSEADVIVKYYKIF